MSFTNLEYDVGAYRQSLRESLAVGSYMTRSLLPDESGRMGVRHTEVESELFGLSRPASEDPAVKYGPGEYDTSHAPRVPESTVVVPHGVLYPEDTRISNPPGNVKEMGFNRFGHPMEQPQDHAVEPFGYPTSDTRNAKDNHMPLLSYPMDVTPLLPPPAPDNITNEFVFTPVPDLPHVQVAQPPKEFRYIL